MVMPQQVLTAAVCMVRFIKAAYGDLGANGQAGDHQLTRAVDVSRARARYVGTTAVTCSGNGSRVSETLLRGPVVVAMVISIRSEPVG